MKIARTVQVARCSVQAWKKEGLRVGLVPTMGFLHEGHISLIRQAAKNNDRVVVSIFVNPMQFGPAEDLDRYPRDIKTDTELCKAEGVDLVFIPEVEDMYPEGFSTTVSVGTLTAGLCGRSRPGHFEGVCTVVCKLFVVITPDRAYFGQKDAQQLAVIRRMARDLNMSVEVTGCPIVREADGLAKSSRNSYLSPEERRAALGLYQSLQAAQEKAASGERDSKAIIAAVRDVLSAYPLLREDYVEIVHPDDLQPIARIIGPALVAVAAYAGGTRLIDNILIKSGGSPN